MQGTSVGGNRMAVGNNQTAHIIGTIPSVSQQFAATPGKVEENEIFVK